MRKGRPRTVRGALRRGWRPVIIKRREDLSWVGILNHIQYMTEGAFVSNYDLQGGGTVAFELEKDALIAQMRFGHFG